MNILDFVFEEMPLAGTINEPLTPHVILRARGAVVASGSSPRYLLVNTEGRQDLFGRAFKNLFDHSVMRPEDGYWGMVFGLDVYTDADVSHTDLIKHRGALVPRISTGEAGRA